MRRLCSIALACIASILLPAVAARSETTPSPSPTPSTAIARTQIDLGNLYRKERNYKEADAAYCRALNSQDLDIRKMALRGLEHSLHEQHDYGFWFRGTLHEFLDTLVEKGTLLVSVVLAALSLWSFLGWMGNNKGKTQCVVVATDKTDPNLAPLFRLAILAEQARRKPLSGPIGTKSMTVSLESTNSDDPFPELISIASEKAGKIATVFSTRLKHPRFHLSIGSVTEQYQTRLLVSLDVEGKVVQVWNQEIGVSDLFLPDCRCHRRSENRINLPV
jgi:hypothetical protein